MLCLLIKAAGSQLIQIEMCQTEATALLTLGELGFKPVQLPNCGSFVLANTLYTVVVQRAGIWPIGDFNYTKG